MARKPKSKFYYSNHLVRQKDGTKRRVGRKQRKRRVSKGPNNGNFNVSGYCLVDDVLKAIVGLPILPKPEVVQRILQYVKRNKLQKPGDGRIILPDERLAALTGEPGVEIHGFKLMTHIQRHIIRCIG
jgi:chromatin remodeling complex protein RSC6